MSTHFWAQYQIVVEGQERAFAFAFTCAFETVDAIHAEFLASRVIRATRLELSRLADGTHLVKDRTPTLLGLSGLVHLQPYRRIVRDQP